MKHLLILLCTTSLWIGCDKKPADGEEKTNPPEEAADGGESAGTPTPDVESGVDTTSDIAATSDDGSPEAGAVPIPVPPTEVAGDTCLSLCQKSAQCDGGDAGPVFAHFNRISHGCQCLFFQARCAPIPKKRRPPQNVENRH